jgi:hypothetical protein
MRLWGALAAAGAAVGGGRDRGSKAALPLEEAMNLQRPFLGLAALLLLGGCFGSTDQLRMKAAADFDCPKDSLTVNDVGNGFYEVAGCDQKQRYTYSSEAKAWLRESDAGGKVK